MSFNFTDPVISSADSAYPLYLSDLDAEKYILPERNNKIAINTDQALGFIAAVAIDIGVRFGYRLCERVYQEIHGAYHKISTACAKNLENGAIIPAEDEIDESPTLRVQEASHSVLMPG